MQRCLEPELMLDDEQVKAFVEGSKDYGIDGFLYLYKKYAGLIKGKVVDLGSGPGQYIDALSKEYSDLEVVGYDGSPAMVNLSSNVTLSNIYNVVDTADLVMSTNTLHHIHNPEKFWNVAKTIAPNVFVMDLVRPPNEETANAIVGTFAKNDSDIFKQDYYNSLCAAFSVEELQDQIKDTNLQLSIEGDFLQVAVIYGVF
jgi:trans-aconitate methyltransferase